MKDIYDELDFDGHPSYRKCPHCGRPVNLHEIHPGSPEIDWSIHSWEWRAVHYSCEFQPEETTDIFDPRGWIVDLAN